MGALRRYGLQQQADQTFGSLSGGQQARFQILLLELSGIDVALARRADRQPRRDQRRSTRGGTRRDSRARSSRLPTIGGSRDRFERFLVFGADGAVYESDQPVFDEGRVGRPAP